MSKGQINSEAKMSKECCPDVFCQTGDCDHNVLFLDESEDVYTWNSTSPDYNELHRFLRQFKTIDCRPFFRKFQRDETLTERDESHASIGTLYANHETHVSEDGEANLYKHLIDCKKNPGHTQFIPVDTFTISHLPKNHCDKDLYDIIKCIIDLTVRVAVKMISPHRPEFWPNTTILYPFYNMRRKTNLRTGSGMVGDVYKFMDGRNQYGGKHFYDYTRCWCKKCQDSDFPSIVWWEFYVHTATHVVFDDTEARHTSLRLFYDEEDSPLISFDQVRAVDVSIERDWCKLTCVTCDKNLGAKLNMLHGHYKNKVWERVYRKYFPSRDVDKLNIIVSHPHGCCKQVSIGHWVDTCKVGEKFQTFTYTTSTCPGSSGALVFCLGYKSLGEWWYNPVHRGSINSECNYSGAGEVL